MQKSQPQISYSFPNGIYCGGTTRTYRYEDKREEDKEMKVTLNDEETTTATTKIEKSKEKKMPATKKEKIEVRKVEFKKLEEKILTF